MNWCWREDCYGCELVENVEHINFNKMVKYCHLKLDGLIIQTAIAIKKSCKHFDLNLLKLTLME